MRRIGLVVVLTFSLLAPIANEAQQPGKTYQIGLLSLAVDPLGPPSPIWQAFIEALRQHNYIEGQNLVLKRAFAGGKRDLLQGLANDLVRSKVDVIVTSASGETRAAKLATSTIPIVMTLVADPVGEGFVASLARPGGNVTGVTSLAVDLSQKSVELLHEIVPSASRFAVIGTPVVEIRHELEAAATHVGTIVSFNKVTGPDDFDPTLAQAPGEADRRTEITGPRGSRTWVSYRPRGSTVSGRQRNAMDAFSPEANAISIIAPVWVTTVPRSRPALRTVLLAAVSAACLHSSRLSVALPRVHLSTSLLGNIECIQATHASKRTAHECRMFRPVSSMSRSPT
jgi:hypothetical protein